MERSATHDTEYIDIVLGYRHILLFSLVFGALVFGTGYFTGYQRGQDAEAERASTTSPRNTSPESQPSQTPPTQVPAMLTEPLTNEGDVVKDMEHVTQEPLTPGETGVESVAPIAPPEAEADPEPAPQVEEKPVEEKPIAAAAPVTAPPVAAPPVAAPPVTKPAKTKRAQAPPAKPKPAPQAWAPEKHHAGGNVYLQVSSFSEQQQAEKLIDDLASEGFKALIDGQLVGGKHTVLVGPFNDFKAALGRAKDLKEHNRQAYPVRR